MFADNRDFQKGMDFDSFRRKRQDDRFSLRKRQREQHLQKRLRSNTGNQDTNTGENEIINHNDISQEHIEKNIHVLIRQLPQTIQALRHGNPEQQEKAVGAVRLMLSHERDPPIDLVLETGVLPQLIEIMSRDDKPSIQFEAAWAVTNLASGTNEHTKAVVEAGAIEAFVRLLQSSRDEILEQAIWGLGNIAGDSSYFRDRILNLGIFPHLLDLVTTVETIELRKNIIWAISNLVRNKAPFHLIKCAIKPLGELLKGTKNRDIIVDCLWSFSYISDTDVEENLQEIVDSGIVGTLVKCLRQQNTSIRQPTMRTLGNIITGTDEQTEAVLRCNFLNVMGLLLEQANTKAVRKECCWAISNVTAGTLQQLTAVLNSGLIQRLVYVAQHDEYVVRREAGWALSNACAGADFSTMQCLISENVIEALSSLLELADQSKTVMMALEGLENILIMGENHKNDGGYNLYVQRVEESGALERMEAIQMSDATHEEVYNACVKLITTYWGEDDDDRDWELNNLNPKSHASGSHFAFGSNSGVNTSHATANIFSF